MIDLLSRQAVEAGLVQRWPQRKQDLVSQLVERQHRAAIAQRLSSSHPADIAFVLESLDKGPRDLAFSLVPQERRGAVLLETSEAVRRALLLDMEPEEIATLIAPLSPADVADLVSSLPEEARKDVLAQLDRAEQAEVRSVLSFPRGTVGSAIDRDFVAVPEEAAIADVQFLLRRRKSLPSHTTQLFVVDRAYKLRGLLALERVVLAEPDALVREQMTESPVVFYTDDSMREAATAFEKYDLVSAPVINLHDQVVGRVTVDAVVDAISERAQREGLRLVGLSQEDEDLSAPVARAARRRWPWISLNLCTAFLGSRVIGAFEPVIVQLVALAALMPIVASLGGNAGQQSVALVIQSMTLGQAGPAQLRRLLRRELAIGAWNGALWGTVLGLVTFLVYGHAGLSLVIAAALLVNLVLASFVGVAAPTLLRWLERDPIMGSSIILTASTDFMGYLAFLGLAAWMLL